MNQSDYYELALKWAPIHYQYIKLTKKDNMYRTKIDLILPVNFESFSCTCTHGKHDHKEDSAKNLVCQNSDDKKCKCKKYKEERDDPWNTKIVEKRLRNADIENLVPVVYYSIAATDSHYYILYSFYHAIDKKHINDMEGCMVIVQRETKDEQEKLLGMMTVAHLSFPKYVYKKRVEFNDIVTGKSYNTSLKLKLKHQLHLLIGDRGTMEAADKEKSENDDLGKQPRIIMYSKALTQQESGGHGLYALGKGILWLFRFIRWFLTTIGRGPDFIMYYPSKNASKYKIKDLFRYKGMPHNRTVYYKLVDIHDKENGLCHKYSNTNTFQESGKFHQIGKTNAASPPWGWIEKKSDGGLTFWNDSIKLVNRGFNPKGSTKNEKIDETILPKKTMNQIYDKEYCNICKNYLGSSYQPKKDSFNEKLSDMFWWGILRRLQK